MKNYGVNNERNMRGKQMMLSDRIITTVCCAVDKTSIHQGGVKQGRYFIKFLICFVSFWFLTLIWVGGEQLKQGNPDTPLPGHIKQLLPGDAKMFPGQPRDIISPAFPQSALWFSPRWACPKHLPRKTSSCPNQLNWLLLMQRSSGSTLSLSQMPELLTLSLRLSPATLWRELTLAACDHNLILSVTTQSSWP